jgi:hypothetical protein
MQFKVAYHKDIVKPTPQYLKFIKYSSFTQKLQISYKNQNILYENDKVKYWLYWNLDTYTDFTCNSYK